MKLSYNMHMMCDLQLIFQALRSELKLTFFMLRTVV